MPTARSNSREIKEDWITRLVAGEAGAFEHIYSIHAASLIRYAATSVPLDVAEDIIQDVFSNLWRRRRELKLRDSELTPYLFGAVRTQTRYYLRSINIRQRHSQSIRDIPGVAPKEYASDKDALANEIYEGIQSALKRIPDVQRETVTLRWVHGLSFREISSVLGISENVAMQYVSRVKRAIQPELKKYFRDS